MKKYLVIAIAVLLSFNVMAAKDERYKKSKITEDVAQEALKNGVVQSFDKTPFSKVIPQSITVNGIHQYEDENRAVIYFTYVAKGSDAARRATVEVIQFTSDYWYFPESGKYLEN